MSTADGFLRVGEEFDFGASLFGDALGIGKNVGIGGVTGRRGDADVNTKSGGEIEERVANVVAVARRRPA